MKSDGAMVLTSNGSRPSSRRCCLSTGTMSSRWLKQAAMSDDELMMATFGRDMSSSVCPRDLHSARRTAQRGDPGVRSLLKGQPSGVAMSSAGSTAVSMRSYSSAYSLKRSTASADISAS
ncbi:hypothetical protein ACFFX0_10610 [Citricoccus parietis]|uniref:Uncharacterized protein n=1 Tax=Citricoccus parietis TaxID=592307 RepID=A0ABV5FY59_9MICC